MLTAVQIIDIIRNSSTPNGMRKLDLETEPRTGKPLAAIGATSGVAFYSALQKRRTNLGLQSSSLAGRKLIPNQSVLALTSRVAFGWCRDGESTPTALKGHRENTTDVSKVNIDAVLRVISSRRTEGAF